MTEKSIRSTILKQDSKGEVRNGAEWLALWSDPDSMRTRAERSEQRQSDRARMELAGQLSAAARSLAGRDDIDLQIGEYDGGGLRASLEELQTDNLPALRGRIDSAALFLRFHDPDLHDQQRPEAPGEARLFSLLELLRCEALGAHRMRGIGDNLVAAHLARLGKSDLLGAHLASLVPLDEAIRMVVGDALVGRREPSVPTSGFWMWERWMQQRLQLRIEALKASLSDQKAYGAAARAFISALYDALHGRGEGPVRREISNRSGGGPEEGEFEHGSGQTDDDSFEPGPEALGGEEEPTLDWPLLDFARSPAHKPYQAYTTRHDQVARAADLVPQQVVREAQKRLDEKRGTSKRALARLVTQLQRRLMARQTRSWTFDLEEGLVDASRLDRVVVNPGFADAYKQEEESTFRDTCVTLLIDNSGSMRGKTIELACIAADLICAALDSCGVATEVLGFTTLGWKGAQSGQDWMRAGRPADPGRLNDLLHIIYKGADEPYRRARTNLCAMMSADLLKENIDGEALLWASRRLMMRSEQRRILLVISDGAPVDQATIEANTDKDLLDRHLRDVIGDIERAGIIEMAAIGVRHDVKHYYRSARRVDAVDDLGPALIGALDAMLLA